MRFLALTSILCLSVTWPCGGQNNAGAGTNPASPEKAKTASLRARGKRDPFRSLLAPSKEAAKQEAPAIPKFRPAGLPGLLISEVNVIGIASNHTSRFAVIQGKEKVSYFGKLGDRLFDGFISGIDMDKVIFTEEIVGADGKKMQRTRTKKLYAEMWTNAVEER
ncbi:MAG: hypothetical protein HY644_13205 [Acidobacteria bacterium]|nr:hypothetical protein [Acidobacteriota bacterium]